MPGQLQSIPFKSLCIALAWIRKGHLDLTEKTTGQTQNTLNTHNNPHRLPTNREAAESAKNLSPANDLLGTTTGASKVKGVLSDSKDYRSTFILALDVLIASNTKSVIKKTCGHNGIPPWL